MGLIEDAKEAVKLVQQIDNIELYRKILDLQAEAIELMEKLREKDEKIKQLEDINSVEIQNNFAYRVIDGKPLGPYCPGCFSKDKKLVELLNIQNSAYGCSICQFILNKDGSGLMSGDRNHCINSYLR
jgi:hypothetical protein